MSDLPAIVRQREVMERLRRIYPSFDNLRPGDQLWLRWAHGDATAHSEIVAELEAAVMPVSSEVLHEACGPIREGVTVEPVIYRTPRFAITDRIVPFVADCSVIDTLSNALQRHIPSRGALLSKIAVSAVEPTRLERGSDLDELIAGKNEHQLVIVGGPNYEHLRKGQYVVFDCSKPFWCEQVRQGWCVFLEKDAAFAESCLGLAITDLSAVKVYEVAEELEA